MHGPALVRGERQVALDHQALGDRGPAGQPELRGDAALVHLAAAREGRFLTVQGERPVGDGAVGKRAAHQPGRRDGPPVVREGDRSGGC